MSLCAIIYFIRNRIIKIARNTHKLTDIENLRLNVLRIELQFFINRIRNFYSTFGSQVRAVKIAGNSNKLKYRTAKENIFPNVL